MLLWTVRGLVLAGAGLLLSGLWWVYPPLSPIVAGLLCWVIAADLVLGGRKS